jgi:hypothetical protein
MGVEFTENYCVPCGALYPVDRFRHDNHIDCKLVKAAKQALQSRLGTVVSAEDSSSVSPSRFIPPQYNPPLSGDGTFEARQLPVSQLEDQIEASILLAAAHRTLQGAGFFE